MTNLTLVGLSGSTGQKTLKKAVFDLYLWQYDQQASHFSVHLYKLMQKADTENFKRLAAVFPMEAQAFRLWHDSEDAKEFFISYLGKDIRV